jgi:hypothetical protein
MSGIEEALIEHWGERCSDFDEGCPTCQAWRELDTLKRSQWQDISTAPKDGTRVDLFGTRNGDPRRFTDARWAPIASWGTGEPTGDFRWMFDAYDVYGEFEFTHWMPLPPAPEAKP